MFSRGAPSEGGEVHASGKLKRIPGVAQRELALVFCPLFHNLQTIVRFVGRLWPSSLTKVERGYEWILEGGPLVSVKFNACGSGFHAADQCRFSSRHIKRRDQGDSSFGCS
jgi:hypothetical protein